MRNRLNLGGALITLVTIIAAILWFFPLYWSVITSLKPEYEVVEPTIRLIPRHWTLDAYVYVFENTPILRWYLNSTVTSAAITILVLIMSAGCAYALSQLRFPGRRLIYGMILVSFMVPIQALIITHFVLMNDFGLINTWLGVILPQLIVPVAVIVYKQFFDSIPREYRESALLDGANEFQIFGRLYVPMNWGVTTALAIITFIAAWNNFLWPFLVTNSNASMTVTVGITQIHENFGVQYARNLAGAVIAASPVAVAYLVFQRRVTDAIMLSAGIKG
ncbi:carbohydrate ABC transporter membrane protein 2, CUT1 family [Faunimonas pinastri]|uniref:Carbohydrate ABC transporter membrane protein 2, CUT1 family n=1 Tax=Faunimonas pinastri TaxID=1855383 RepID=A0A1H9K1A0_9HYPH|nr:carbohydrate ABC transporter permease [Faunimonas pinastri]SEQ92747.1 carbohydrate ABC transporter membrane protein 2, CUT1 family [Faunimonas pinastri]